MIYQSAELIYREGMASRCSLHWTESDVVELLASHKSKETSQQGKQVAKNTNNQGCSSLAFKYCCISAQSFFGLPNSLHNIQQLYTVWPSPVEVCREFLLSF